MNHYILQLVLKSDTLIGSGDGWASTINNDIVFDDIGLPFIPARRIKGCLRELALQLEYWLLVHNIMSQPKVNNLFGISGRIEPGKLLINDCLLVNRDENKAWLDYIVSKTKFITKEQVISYFSSVRTQTSIDQQSGNAKKQSLRFVRVLNQELVFNGNIDLYEKLNSDEIKFLAILISKFQNIGSKRTRGFGNIQCKLLDNQNKDLGKKTLESMMED